MKFRIVEVKNNPNPNYKYAVYYLDEFDNRGIKWNRVIWDEESYCHFKDTNFTPDVETAKYQAAVFKDKYCAEHGYVVDEFDF